MCFGNDTTSTKTTTPSAAVSGAANSNLNFVQDLQNKGFQGYTGQQVAGIDPAQQGTINAAVGTVNDGTGDAAKGLINNYAGAPAGSVSPQTISSQMSPYMNQYVMQALAPQLQQMDINNAKTAQATNANATGSGAFGDARTGIEQATNAQNANVAREGLIGSAYNTAFNTAIGAGAQDVSNNLTGQTTNANLGEQALQRSLGGATALQGLQTGQIANQTATNALTQQDTAKSQADLTAQYNQWLMAQQYPFQTAQLANQTVAAANGAMPTTTTETAPDNSGMALLGAAVGTAGKLALSDRRAKKDIDLVGKLNDGSNVYSFVYKGDPSGMKHIGLMAQEVKKRRPDAVERRADGYLAVDYGKATALSRAMSAAI